MTDYYSVIRRAVAALETNNLEDRRAIYSRARAVLESQLGKRPLNKAHCDRERSMLEGAISRVEAVATNKRIITYASQRKPVQLKRDRRPVVSGLGESVSQDITVITVAGGLIPAAVPGPSAGAGLPGLI